ncbi:MAG: LssY C-terminal domain-containing protein, partial [Candidatus Acidiferrales bacterium]
MNTHRIWIACCAACALALGAQPLLARQTQETQQAQTAASETPSPGAQTGASDNQKSHDFTVGGTVQWMDTKIDLRAGEKLQITGSGTITYPANPSSKSNSTTPQTFGPDGLARGWQDLIHEYAVTSGGHGALIGRLGSADAAQPFLVGASLVYTAPVAGRLYLGINQSLKDAGAASGSFSIKIAVLDPGASTADAANVGGPAETEIAGITSDLLGKLPRRVNDPQGNPGDMVNILIVGTEDQVVNVFTTAGWVHVDSSVQGT